MMLVHLNNHHEKRNRKIFPRHTNSSNTDHVTKDSKILLNILLMVRPQQV